MAPQRLYDALNDLDQMPFVEEPDARLVEPSTRLDEDAVWSVHHDFRDVGRADHRRKRPESEELVHQGLPNGGKRDVVRQFVAVLLQSLIQALLGPHGEILVGGDADDLVARVEFCKDDGVDFLINNAGFGLAGEFTATDLDAELNMIDVNIRAVHILTKLFLRDFTARDSGIILNVASSAGFMPGPLLSTYYASKNYVLRLTEAIYEELRRKNSRVRISALCPGPVNTEFNNVAKVKFAVRGISSEDCARIAVDGALKGKLVIIPSFTIKAGLFFRRFAGEKFLLKLAYNFQKRKSE